MDRKDSVEVVAGGEDRGVRSGAPHKVCLIPVRNVARVPMAIREGARRDRCKSSGPVQTCRFGGDRLIWADETFGFDRYVSPSTHWVIPTYYTVATNENAGISPGAPGLEGSPSPVSPPVLPTQKPENTGGN